MVAGEEAEEAAGRRVLIQTVSWAGCTGAVGGAGGVEGGVRSLICAPFGYFVIVRFAASFARAGEGRSKGEKGVGQRGGGRRTPTRVHAPAHAGWVTCGVGLHRRHVSWESTGGHAGGEAGGVRPPYLPRPPSVSRS